MIRTTLDYYRIFAGWEPNAGSIQVAITDFKSLPIQQRRSFCTILHSAAKRNSLIDHEVAGQFVDTLVDFPVR